MTTRTFTHLYNSHDEALFDYYATAQLVRIEVATGKQTALGKPGEFFADYFEICRRKRNIIDYDHSHVATETEASEVLQKAQEFNELVENWIASNYPALK